MRAVQLTAHRAPLVDSVVPDPEPGPGEVLIAVRASGICHSDAHYRSGDPAPSSLPITLGHEIAGEVVAVGDGVASRSAGNRVAVHYVLSDGTCDRCVRFGEQFCERYDMLGLTVDGGYAEYLVVPEANTVPIPDEVPITHAAVMMCSSATSLHALGKGRVAPGETVAVFGAGGLGMSAIQLAKALDASTVFAVDINEQRLGIAEGLGGTPLHAAEEPAAAIQAAGGADVALCLVDRAEVFEAAHASLARRGRLVSVGIGRQPVSVEPYGGLIEGEHELIGSNDHTLDELYQLFAFASEGELNLTSVVTDEIPLEASAVNATLDRLDGYGTGIRSVIRP